jgi:hypothetical protein
MSESKRRQAFYKQRPEHRLGDAPIEEKYRQEMIEIASLLDKCFNDDGKRKTGFVLMVFPYGDTSGRCNYISNGADRKDIVVLMKEMIARFEGQAEVTGNA